MPPANISAAVPQLGTDEFWYGNEGLWLTLPKNGVRPLWPNNDGVFGDKVGWWRTLRGALTISGKRLDMPAPPLEVYVPDGYGPMGFQASGVVFPSPGCWEVTGQVAGTALTFVNCIPDRGATAKVAPEAVPIVVAPGYRVSGQIWTQRTPYGALRLQLRVSVDGPTLIWQLVEGPCALWLDQPAGGSGLRVLSNPFTADARLLAAKHQAFTVVVPVENVPAHIALVAHPHDDDAPIACADLVLPTR